MLPKMGCRKVINDVELSKTMFALQLKNSTLRDTGCFFLFKITNYITISKLIHRTKIEPPLKMGRRGLKKELLKSVVEKCCYLMIKEQDTETPVVLFLFLRTDTYIT